MILFAKPGFAALAWMLLAGCWSVLAAADTSTENGILERLQRLEENQARLEAQLRERDQRIQELESALGVDQPQQGTSMEGARVTPAASEPAEVTASATGDEFAAQENGYFGEFQEGGLGIKLADTPKGELNFSASVNAAKRDLADAPHREGAQQCERGRHRPDAVAAHVPIAERACQIAGVGDGELHEPRCLLPKMRGLSAVAQCA